MYIPFTNLLDVSPTALFGKNKFFLRLTMTVEMFGVFLVTRPVITWNLIPDKRAADLTWNWYRDKEMSRPQLICNYAIGKL